MFTRAALDAAAAEARDPAEREHVTVFILLATPERFRIAHFTQGPDHSRERWTLDTPEDYALLSRIFEAAPDPLARCARTRSRAARPPTRPGAPLNAHIEQEPEDWKHARSNQDQPTRPSRKPSGPVNSARTMSHATAATSCSPPTSASSRASSRARQGISSVIEFGANVGMNLRALHQLLPAAVLAGVEINEAAAAELEAWGKAEVFHTRSSASPPRRAYAPPSSRASSSTSTPTSCRAPTTFLPRQHRATR
jgi:spore coat polysaccharide biosynthesis protein SpsF